MRKQRNQANRAVQFDRDRAVIPGSGSVDSKGGEIPPIIIDRGGRHIGEVVAAAMRAVRRKKLNMPIFIRCAHRSVKRPLGTVTAKA